MKSISPNNAEHALPLLSVITVVYNDASNLNKTIESVVEQIYSDFEYVIIDGGSTDATVNIIKDKEQYIDYWKSECDSGIYDAMNKGIQASSGNYLLFMNAGDCFANNKVIMKIAGDIINNNKPDLLYGGANVLSEKGLFIKELKPLDFSSFNLTLFGTRTVCHQSIIVKKSITPLFNANYKLKGELAWYYDILNIKSDPKIIKLNYPVSNYLLGGVSDNTLAKNIWERVQVVYDKKGILGCAITIPSLIIPLVFRFKRILVKSK